MKCDNNLIHYVPTGHDKHIPDQHFVTYSVMCYANGGVPRLRL